MGKSLVIVESPAKAKTIGKILGPGFEVKSSVGHIRDLPERALGVDIEHGFAPKYVLSKDKSKIVTELKKAAKACDAVFLAPDPDREGEAIAWHLSETLKSAARGKPFYRVQYNEITPRAVAEAFRHPGEININRVNAQQARRILDRLVGYMVSPMLWRQLKKGLSAGRVQSVALRLVAERERQIRAFQVEEYWVMGAKARRTSAPLDPFEMRLARVDGKKPAIPAKGDAEALLRDLQGASLRVSEIRTRETARRPLPPFITSTLQQAASSVCGFSPYRTMSLAQKLYEGVDLGNETTVGLITYMRTDSVNIANDARDAARDFITKTYGAAYYPEKPNFYKSRAGAQEAHEAIRPTDVTRTPEKLRASLEPAALKLYELIWKRFVASQMAPAKIAQKTVSAKPEKDGPFLHDYLFAASSSEAAFDGFLKVTALDFRRKKADGEEDEESDEVPSLPPLEEGLPLDVLKWLSERKETKPPSRYSEASLIKALEANGVGRPSTYASILETLNTRNYTTREKKQLTPTQLGLDVNDLLVSKMERLFDVGFTAKMEGALDKVEAGETGWTQMLSDFYAKFVTWVDQAKEPPADLEKVSAVLKMLEQVKEWGSPMKRGRRVYSDEKFVTSIREQLAAGEKPVSGRQLDAIGKIAVRYRSQIPGADDELVRLGFGEELEKDRAAPSGEDAMRRFAVLKNVPLTESQNAFIESLKMQVGNCRRLSERQLAAVDRIIVQHAAMIEDYERVRGELGLAAAGEVSDLPPDSESPLLLEMLGQVKEWQPAVARGKMVFDDRAFFVSLSAQHAQKKFLSPRQRYAMKRMVFRYRGQIADFDRYVERLGLGKYGKGRKRDPNE